jgi:hypothetical protein
VMKRIPTCGCRIKTITAGGRDGIESGDCMG